MKRHYIADIVFRILLLLMFAFFVGGLIFALSSCKPKKEIVERYLTDTVWQSRADTLRIVNERVDSVVCRDSVFTIIRGDTVLIREYHYRDRTKMTDNETYKTSNDTVWKTRTVTEYKTVTVEVEKRLHWWQKALMWIGGLALIGAGVMIWRRAKQARPQ